MESARGLNVFGDLLDVVAESFVAGFTDEGVRVVDFLDHGAQQAGVFGELAFQNGDAEIDIAQEAVERVEGGVVRGGGEQMLGHGTKVSGSFDGELFFGFEVMEEGAFGDTCVVADVVNGGGGVTLCADDVEGGVEEFCFGRVGGLHVHTHWYV